MIGVYPKLLDFIFACLIMLLVSQNFITCNGRDISE